jgi:hypothetical protein
VRRFSDSRRASASRALAQGFGDGALATLPMSGFMLLAQRLGAMGRQPPRKIAEAGLYAAGVAPPSPVKKAAATALHFGFGGAAGAAFAEWARRSPRRAYGGRRHPDRARGALSGALFGTLVWASSYMGWVPALGIMPPAHHDRRGRPLAMIAAHWIYGAALGWRTAARAA